MQRAWNARDPGGLAAALRATTRVIHSPIFGEVHGTAGDREVLSRSVPRVRRLDLRTDRTSSSTATRAAQVFNVTATHTSELFGVDATHRSFKVQGVLVFEFRDGQIAVEQRLYDFTGAADSGGRASRRSRLNGQGLRAKKGNWVPAVPRAPVPIRRSHEFPTRASS